TVDTGGPVPFHGIAAASIADASAAIALAAGATLRAANDVTLNANATSSAQINTQGRFVGITFGSSTPTATVTVANGVTVDAGHNVNASATTNNTLDITTTVPATGEIANVSFSYGKADAESDVDFQAGSTLHAGNDATVQATNTNSYR